MKTYKDRTYCASKIHLPGCNRILSKKESDEASKLNADICWSYFCDVPEFESMSQSKKEE